ncbi:MAG TPA: hypothetical protein ENK23_07805 [Sorangium sp.]|nr:hypothetical protein [Sorangium sp.]
MTSPPLGELSPLSGRDGQLRSPFSHILARLCGSCRGIEGAGIVDEEGESVDIHIVRCRARRGALGRLDGFTIKLAGACFQIALRQANCEDPERLTRLEVETNDQGYVVAPLGGGFLGKGYVLVVLCAPGTTSRVSPRALREAVVGIAGEAGWNVPRPEKPRWRRVRVQSLPDGAPYKVDGVAVQRLSRAPSAGPGFTRRYHIGMGDAAALLVREPSGHWYLRSPGVSAAAPERHNFAELAVAKTSGVRG